MRKILSKEEIERKNRRNQLILAVILVALMFISVLGYGFIGRPSDTIDSQSTKQTINRHTFNYIDGLWETNFNGQKISLLNNPSDIIEIFNETEGNQFKNLSDIYSYSGRPLYYHGDASKIAFLLNNIYPYAERAQGACVEGLTCENPYYPTKNCNSSKIIIYQESNQTNIIQDGGCLFINSPSEKAQEISDFLTLKIFRIIN